MFIMQIILPNTVCDGTAKTKLYQLLSEQFDEATLTTVQRKYFNESKGKVQRVSKKLDQHAV